MVTFEKSLEGSAGWSAVVGGFWKGFPGRKNSMNKGREAWQGTYMAQLTYLSSLGALQAEPARTGH